MSDHFVRERKLIIKNGKKEDIIQHRLLLMQPLLSIIIILYLIFLEVMQVQLILIRHPDAISEIINSSKKKSRKSICFVTGVPGAGKTLVGLNIATKHFDKSTELYSVFLSGNGPLVKILREALTRDKVKREKINGNKIKKGRSDE